MLAVPERATRRHDLRQGRGQFRGQFRRRRRRRGGVRAVGGFRAVGGMRVMGARVAGRVRAVGGHRDTSVSASMRAMESGALCRGHRGQRLPFQVGDGFGGAPRGGLAVRGQHDHERAAVAGVVLAHDVSAPGQPIEQAGQRAGPGGGGGGQRAHRPARTVGHVGQHVDVGRGQVKIGQPGRERVQGRMSGPVQGEDRAARVSGRGYHDIVLYDIVVARQARAPGRGAGRVRVRRQLREDT